MTGVFHEGEEAVQRRAGVHDQAAMLGSRTVQPELSADHAAFLQLQPFVVVGSATADGRVWASMLTGPPGFAHAPEPDRVLLHAAPDRAHPLGGLPPAGRTPIGLLVLDAMTRDRLRINGTARRTREGIEMAVGQVFGNCPKYIQTRRPVAVERDRRPGPLRVSGGLDDEQRTAVLRADTFFIASRHPERGADASHRGGRPGFVVPSTDGRFLTFPDYQGNNMFQTLGNLSVEPAVGLLFTDWDTGRAMHLTGRASIVWDDPRVERWPGARRLVDVRIDRVVDRPGTSPIRWELVEAHRLNPDVPPRDPEQRTRRPRDVPDGRSASVRVE